MRNPWVAIMVAGDRGCGLHLTAEEVGLLVQDSAIEACAENDVERTGHPPVKDWSKIDARKYPTQVRL